MEGLRNSPRFDDTNRRWQCPVQCALQVPRRNRSPQGKAGDLRQSVDTRVGPARPLWQWSFPRDAAERRLQLSLDGWFAGLNLPAAEIRAVIGQGQLPGLCLFLEFGRCSHLEVLALQGTRRRPSRGPMRQWDILSFLHFMTICLPQVLRAGVQGTKVALIA